MIQWSLAYTQDHYGNGEDLPNKTVNLLRGEFPLPTLDGTSLFA